MRERVNRPKRTPEQERFPEDFGVDRVCYEEHGS